MAQIALTIAGNAIGGPVGGAIGGFIGGFIDSKLFGGGSQKLPDQVGPRILEMSVQGSTYGSMIPQVYGRARMAGNVIWTKGIREVEVRETQTVSTGGGKGGGGSSTQSQTTITYEYYATLAIAVCEGEVDSIERVWADSKIITSEELEDASGKYEVHLGSESQTASTIIESYEGAGEAPAYRGTAYIVIEDFPLAAYGNRIPNFTFEVKRTSRFTGLEEKIKDITIIPGSGEFVYGQVITDKNEVTEDVDGNTVQTGKREKMNMHNFDNVANVTMALDQLAEALPNIEWVSVVVNWFITSSVVANAEVVPKVEFAREDAEVSPTEWSVAGLTRQTADVVEFFPDGSPTYGGTPSDHTVVALCKELKNRGYNVLLYPMPLVDTVDDTPGESDKPWRGRMVPTSAADVNTFNTRANGYDNFIRHYSQLIVGGDALKDYIDAFIIGTEMIGMTTYDSGSNNYPFVNNLVTLLNNVRSDVGAGVLLSYAADWTEYHSDGTGYYHLDSLWTQANLDFVGIDAYFPLTPDLPQAQITAELIEQYWEEGEGWDYFYTDAVNRTGQTNYSDATYAWKNLEHWWNTTHYHNNDGVSATGWTPKAKPIWFTEIGFPSVDGAANQPNVFVDPTSVESFYPRGSQERVDFIAQRVALETSLDYLSDRAAETGKANLVPRAFVWTWDARPFPFWPDLLDVWSDGVNWKTGHWINGKVGVSTLGAIVAAVLQQVGLSSSDYDVSELTDIVQGFVIPERQTARDIIDTLQAAYFFDMVESNGQLKFVKRGKSSVVSLVENDLVPLATEPIRESLNQSRRHELELPNSVDITYINRVANYNAGSQRASRQTVISVDRITLNVPVVLTDTEAKQIAEKSLYTAWVARNKYTFRLPTKYAYLEPTDVITITVNGVDHVLRLLSTQLERNGLMECKAVAEDISTYDFYAEPGNTGVVQTPGDTIPDTDLVLLDINMLPTDDDSIGTMRAALTSLGLNWRGATLYRSDDGGTTGGNTFSAVDGSTSEAIKGLTLNALPAGPTHVFDNTNYIDVALLNGTLASTSELAVLNGANVAVVGDEIIQFKTATLTGTNVYRLTGLLRGRMGTEHEVGNHAVQDKFVFLDSAVLKIGMPLAFFGIQKHYKPVTAGQLIANVTEETFTYTGKKFKPWSPVDIVGARDGSDNLTITWKRRTRIGGDWRDGVDIPLGEESEAYQIDIMDGSTVLRTIEATSQTASYTAADQTTDFGSPQSSIEVNIYQMSAKVGRGYAGNATI